jgi:hypothetical protein
MSGPLFYRGGQAQLFVWVRNRKSATWREQVRNRNSATFKRNAIFSEVRNLATIFGIFLAMESGRFMKKKSEVKNLMLLTLYGKFVESLQSHMIFTMSDWSSGLPVCFLPQGTQVQIPWGGTYVKPGFSC